MFLYFVDRKRGGDVCLSEIHSVHDVELLIHVLDLIVESELIGCLLVDLLDFLPDLIGPVDFTQDIVVELRLEDVVGFLENPGEVPVHLHLLDDIFPLQQEGALLLVVL